MVRKTLKKKTFLEIQWKRIFETNHFIFLIPEELLFQKADAIRCEKHFLNVCKAFGFPTHWKNKIKIYLAPNRDFIKKVFDRETYGFILNRSAIVSIYAFHPHEITHLIFEHCLGKSHPVFEEGVAVLYGWRKGNQALWRGRSLIFWMKKLQKENKIVSLNVLFDNFSSIDSLISYPLSGVFVQCFIDDFGTRSFKKIYAAVNRRDSYKTIKKKFKVITGKDFDQFENKFWRKFQ